MSKIRAAIVMSAAFALLLPQYPSHAIDYINRLRIDATIAEIAPLIFCKNDNQFDCIEAVIVEHPDGTVENAQYVDTKIIPFPDSEGQPANYGDVTFDFHNESNFGQLKRVRISTHVQTPEFKTQGKKWAVLWLALERSARPGEVLEGGGKCDNKNIRTCFTYPALDTQDRFNVYFRTSWMKPVASGGEGIDASLDFQKIPGGIRWKFSGIEFLQPGFISGDTLRQSVLPEGANLLPDTAVPRLYAVIDHAGTDLSDSYWDPSCADYGFTRTIMNAPLAGQLFWDYKTESLNFNVYAPHLDVLGGVNKGEFHTRFQKAWLDCRFPGNTLSTATKISVQVIDAQGVPQVAISSSSIKDGIIDISAYGFHYSSPKIVAKAAADSNKSAEAPRIAYADDWNDTLLFGIQGSKTPATNTKKSTIVCYKGLLSKKITSFKPVCPKGYKKK